MGFWSAENATNAYLKTMKMGKGAKQPDIAEFISALAAGNASRLMLVAGESLDSTTAATRALVAAAKQTGGRVVSVAASADELRSYKTSLGKHAKHVEFVIGDVETLLRNEYREADFVVVDCNLSNSESVLEAAAGSRVAGGVVLGYNALFMAGRRGLNGHLLPIGGGLLVARGGGGGGDGGGLSGAAAGKSRSRWIVTVDECTGEQHVFRVNNRP